MRPPLVLWIALAAAGLLALLALWRLSGRGLSKQEPSTAARPPSPTVRIALFNIKELSTERLRDVDADGKGRDEGLRAAAEILREARPDVLVVQEIDLDLGGDRRGGDLLADLTTNIRRFRDAYLNREDDPLPYPYLYAAPTNTGVLSGFDLDDDGIVATEADRGTRRHGGDSWGFGVYPGQYSMAVLSRFPLVAEEARTFGNFLWKDLPGSHLPEGFYSAEEAARMPLSSKSHWDLPVELPAGSAEAPDGGRLHLLISHPTPPVFDGPEDRNGRRNYDEIGFWAHYLNDSEALYDDAGTRGGLPEGEPFVIIGDLNADPRGGEAVLDGRRAIAQLLEHPRVQDPAPRFQDSPGAREHALRASRAEAAERAAEPLPVPADAGTATAEFGGGQRVDYVLPSEDLEVAGGGVYWPSEADDPEGHRRAAAASDHRLVWVDVDLAHLDAP